MSAKPSMISLNKRWQRRAQVWVKPEGRAVFDPRGYSADVLRDDRLVRQFICEHHYEGTMSALTIAVGLFGPAARLVGVAVFGESAGPAVLPKYAGTLRASALELGRFVLLPEVAFNGETWFLARAFRIARREKTTRVVLSFADPLERSANGLVVKPAHWGTIYQASNALYVGQALRRTQLVCPDGRPFSPRALSKITGQERGWEYATRQLLTVGAPTRCHGESGVQWLARVRATPGFTRRRHPGNHAYLFGLDEAARVSLRSLHAARALPYPKKVAA